MESFIIEVMNNWGYIGIFLLIMLENLFPPIPSEIILTFGGFMTIESSLSIIGVIVISTIGSLIGGIILYYIGKIFNVDTLIKIVTSKYGKLLRIKPKDIKSADKWFDNKGNKAVFFCRFIPIVRSLISIPAGMSEMPYQDYKKLINTWNQPSDMLEYVLAWTRLNKIECYKISSNIMKDLIAEMETIEYNRKEK